MTKYFNFETGINSAPLASQRSKASLIFVACSITLKGNCDRNKKYSLLRRWPTQGPGPKGPKGPLAPEKRFHHTFASQGKVWSPQGPGPLWDQDPMYFEEKTLNAAPSFQLCHLQLCLCLCPLQICPCRHCSCQLLCSFQTCLFQLCPFHLCVALDEVAQAQTLRPSLQ